MKYIKSILAVSLVLGMFSCKKQEIGCITADKTDFLFDYTPSEQACTVKGDGKVSASSSQMWCEVTLTDDASENLRIHVLANPATQTRKAKITLSADGCADLVLNVTQTGLGNTDDPYLIAETEDIHVSEKATTEFLTIYTNSKSVDIISHPEWCVPEFLANKEEDNLRLAFEANDIREERKGEVVLGAEGCENLVINVSQEKFRSPDCDLLSFELKSSGNSLDKNLTFRLDKDERTLDAMYLTWIDKQDPEMLIPTFTMTGEKAMVGEQVVISGETAISFADDFDLVVVAENGDRKTYRVSLNCPQINRELPVLHMKPDWEITDKENYVPTAIELYDKTPESTGEGWWDSDVQGKVEMRGRGNSTWGLPKKPYRLKFPEDFSPIGLNHACEKSWVLLAHDMDKSLMRNALGFELSSEMFDPEEGRHDPSAVLFTPATRFINVYQNGKYYGVFQMSDQIQRKKGRIAVDKLEAVDGSDPSKITGGYILECDLHEGNWTSSHNIRWSIKYPEDDDYDPAQYSYIKNFLNTAEAALYGYNYQDPVNGWRKYFDEKTLVDFLIVKELSGDMDGFTSIYIYKRRGIDKFFFGPIWDVDKGWRNDNRDMYYGQELMLKAGFRMNYQQYDWFNRLWDDPTFRQAVNTRWQQKKGDLERRINSYLDEMETKMYKAVRANFGVTEERDNWSGFAANNKYTTCPWPWMFQDCQDAPLPKANYDAEIQYIRDVTEDRIKVLDRKFAE